MSPAVIEPISVRKLAARLVDFALAHQPVAEDVLLADDGVIVADEPLFESEHGEPGLLATQVLGLGQGGDVLHVGQAVVGEHAGEALARAVGPAGEDHVLGLRAQRADVLGGGGEDVLRIVLAPPVRSRVLPVPPHRRPSRDHRGCWCGLMRTMHFSCRRFVQAASSR